MKWPNISANGLYSYLEYKCLQVAISIQPKTSPELKELIFLWGHQNTITLQGTLIPRIQSSSEEKKKHFKVVWIRRKNFLKPKAILFPTRKEYTRRRVKQAPSEPQALPGQCRCLYRSRRQAALLTFPTCSNRQDGLKFKFYYSEEFSALRSSILSLTWTDLRYLICLLTVIFT